VTDRGRSTLAKAGVVLLLLAVALCLGAPMASHDDAGAMAAAAVCCFALVLVAAFAISHTGGSMSFASDVVPSRDPVGRLPRARGPDPVSLGVLLI
jgi:hypothetical protein